MGRIGITYGNVANAAAELTGQNQSPTIDRIRELLGTGSKTTIAKYLQQWKTKQSEYGLYHSESSTLPQDLLAHIKGLWDHMQNHANERIEKAESSMQQKIESIEADLAEQKKLNYQLQAQSQKLEVVIQQKDQETNDLKITLQKAQETIIRHEEKLAGTLNELGNAAQENQQLHRHLEALEKNLKHYQDSIQKQSQQQSLELENQRNRHEHALAQEKSENKALRQTIDQTKQELQNTKTEITTLKSNTQLLEMKLAHIEQSATAKNTTINALELKLTDNNKYIGSLNHELSQLNKKIIEQTNENKGITIELNNQQQNQNKLESKMAELANKNADLTSQNTVLKDKLKLTKLRKS